jgi:hypothetical protein
MCNSFWKTFTLCYPMICKQCMMCCVHKWLSAFLRWKHCFISAFQHGYYELVVSDCSCRLWQSEYVLWLSFWTVLWPNNWTILWLCCILCTTATDSKWISHSNTKLVFMLMFKSLVFFDKCYFRFRSRLDKKNKMLKYWHSIFQEDILNSKMYIYVL